MVFCLYKILFKTFLGCGKHVLNALGEQISNLDAFVLRVLQLVTGNLFEDVPLILCHRLEDKGESKLLVVIFGRVSVWLPLELVFKLFKGVQRHTDKVVLVQQGVCKEHACLYVVHGDDEAYQGERGKFT